jgi:hypothetical protein
MSSVYVRSLNVVFAVCYTIPGCAVVDLLVSLVAVSGRLSGLPLGLTVGLTVIIQLHSV